MGKGLSLVQAISKQDAEQLWPRMAQNATWRTKVCVVLREGGELESEWS